MLCYAMLCYAMLCYSMLCLLCYIMLCLMSYDTDVTWHDIDIAIDIVIDMTWRCHQMETFSALLAICAGNSPVTGEFSTQRPVTRSFDVFFDMRLGERLSKQSWGLWFETPSRPLWRHINDMIWYDTIWYDMIWYDVTWQDIIMILWYDMIWYDIYHAHDMAWHDMTWHWY